MKKTLIISLITAIISVSCCKKNEEKDPKNCNCNLVRETYEKSFFLKREILQENSCIDEKVNVGKLQDGKYVTLIFWECNGVR